MHRNLGSFPVIGLGWVALHLYLTISQYTLVSHNLKSLIFLLLHLAVRFGTYGIGKMGCIFKYRSESLCFVLVTLVYAAFVQVTTVMLPHWSRANCPGKETRCGVTLLCFQLTKWPTAQEAATRQCSIVLLSYILYDLVVKTPTQWLGLTIK